MRPNFAMGTDLDERSLRISDGHACSTPVVKFKLLGRLFSKSDKSRAAAFYRRLEPLSRRDGDHAGKVSREIFNKPADN